MALDIDTRFGVYTIVGKLGEGGMGEVYRARDTTPGSRRRDQDPARGVRTRIPSALARFQREAKTLASLNHPNIARHPRPRGGATASPALVLELVEGPTLAERIAQGPIPTRRGAADREARSRRRSKPRTSRASFTAI